MFSGKEHYLASNIHDELIELLLESTNETMKVKKLISLNPRLKTIDGLYDKENWVGDANTSQTGLALFKKWFAERNLFSPHANIYNFDLGKLVVSSIFMDFDLLETIAKNYDQANRIIRRTDGLPLVTINPKEIRELFGLEPLIDYHVPINLQELEKEYMSKRDVIGGVH